MLAALLLPFPALFSSSATLPTGDWTALELPGPSVAAPRSGVRQPSADGRHVYLYREGGEGSAPGTPLIPAEIAIQLLESRARRAGEELTLLPGSPPLLARGSEAALESARATLRELDEAGTGLRFSVSARMLPLEGNVALAEYGGVYRPGEWIEFGERDSRPFLASYDVDVATDSGIASPIIGFIETGRKLSLLVHRVGRGTRFFVSGTLDLAELDSVVQFDTEAPDLGLVEQPVVDSVQLTFSALVDPGTPLELAVAGCPLEQPDFRIVLQFEDAAAPRTARSLELLDLSFLADKSPRLPNFELAEDEYFREAGSVSTFPAIPTRAITSLASERRSSTGLYASNSALLLDLSSPETSSAALDLIAAYEEGRLARGQMDLRFGSLSVSLPSTPFAPTRVSVGRERTYVSGYQAEIAPESWMPAPQIERRFNGLVVDASQAGPMLQCGAIATRSAEPTIFTRFEAGLGRLQLAPRSALRGQRQVRAGASGESLWPKSAQFAELLVTFSQQ